MNIIIIHWIRKISRLKWRFIILPVGGTKPVRENAQKTHLNAREIREYLLF